MRIRATVALSISTTLFLCACGGSGGTSGPDIPESINEQEIFSFVSDFVEFEGIQNGIGEFNDISFSLNPAGSTCSTSCNFNLGTCQIFCQATATAFCPNAGTVTASGQLSGTIALAGNSGLTWQSRSTYADCRFATPQQVCVIPSGAPNTALNGDFPLINGLPAPTWTFRGSGAFALSCAPSGYTGTCFINSEYRFSTATGNLTQSQDNSYCCPGPSPACT